MQWNTVLQNKNTLLLYTGKSHRHNVKPMKMVTSKPLYIKFKVSNNWSRERPARWGGCCRENKLWRDLNFLSGPYRKWSSGSDGSHGEELWVEVKLQHSFTCSVQPHSWWMEDQAGDLAVNRNWLVITQLHPIHLEHFTPFMQFGVIHKLLLSLKIRKVGAGDLA